jgi:predicted O-methyltransferase YrrM
VSVVRISQIEMRKLPLESFDFIYIDGSHMAEDVLEDAVLAWRLLKPGGLIIFDDYVWRLDHPPEKRPRLAIDAFYRFYANQIEVVHNAYQLILRKKK